MISKFINLAEQGRLPDSLVRFGIRRLCHERLQDECRGDAEAQQQRFQTLIEDLRKSPIAIETEAANQQHYEVPTEFYLQVLGKNLKYSSCYYPSGNESLDQAEDVMLDLYCQRADLQDGQHVLELGCGWGSLTLYMARKYPASQITGVSNSATQRTHIMQQCAERGLDNVEIITADVNQLSLPQAQFDRVVSIEMFEHMRNYRQLMQNISGWLKQSGKLFVHIFVHRYLMYPFEVQNDNDWMSAYFFTGGLMPAADTLLHFQERLVLEQRWLLDGTHYQRTSNHWLANMDSNSAAIMPLFRRCYGETEAVKWFNRWRIFFMSCAELFGLRSGQEWMVAHYLFSNQGKG
ncbi:MAG: cyclopropane-fatty-acyl-phospholipid synthase family protein [Arenicella sp.]|nr:cyclopropane-fatty-acyl-phospholipid synthase family protein [Arenicella sp.]